MILCTRNLLPSKVSLHLLYELGSKAAGRDSEGISPGSTMVVLLLTSESPHVLVPLDGNVRETSSLWYDCQREQPPPHPCPG